MIGTTEIIVIALVALVLFGSTALPRFARSLGQARREFEKGLREGAGEGKQEPAGEAPRGRSRPKR
jgi:sec-independent protein translocase protein TatA